MLDPHGCLLRQKCHKISDFQEPSASATQRERRRRVDSNLVSTISERSSADCAWLTEELTEELTGCKDISLAGNSVNGDTTSLHATLGTVSSGLDRQWLTPNVKNDRGQTPLHVALENDIPIDCLRLLLNKTTDVNACDDQLRSPLQQILTSPHVVDPACFRLLLQAGAHLCRAESSESMLPPIYLLCQRSTDFPALIAVVREEVPDTLWQYKNGILRHAVKCGSEAAIQALLDEFGEDSEVKQSLDSLVLEAASSVHDAEGKVKKLISRGANIVSNSTSRQTIIHIAARKGSKELVEISLQHGQDPNQQDEAGNAAVHCAALSEDENSVECIHLLVRYGADVNAINRQGKLPISIAIAAGHGEQVLALLKLGSNLPPPTIAREVSVTAVAALADDKIIKASPNPLEATLELGTFYKKCASIQTSCGNEYKDLALSMEIKAMKMLGSKGGQTTSNILSRDTIFMAVSNSQKKFLAHPEVQAYLMGVWWSLQRNHPITIASIAWLLLLYISRIAMIPVILLYWFLPFSKHHSNNHINKWLKKSPPCIRHTASTFLYIIFLSILVWDSPINGSLKKKSLLQVTDYIMLVYVISFCLQQATVGVQQGLYRYLSNWSNIVCALFTILFSSYCILRFLVLLQKGKESFQSTELAYLRVASLLWALAVFLACLHLLNYLKVYSGIGHILMSLYSISLDVVLFLLIFVIIAAAFVLCMMGVYAASQYTYTYESAIARCLNGNTSLEFNVSLNRVTTQSDCINGLLDSFQSERPIPVSTSGFVVTMANMIWALFGLTEMPETEAASTLEMTILKLMFTLWLLVAIFVLLNMCCTILEDKQKSKEDELQFARAVAICDLEMAPSVPPPLNILYSVAMTTAYLCSHWLIKKNDSSEDTVDADCSARSASTMIKNYDERVAKELDTEFANKGDIKSISQNLLTLKGSLLSWSSCLKCGSRDSGTLSFDPDISRINPRSQNSPGNTEVTSDPAPVCQQLLEMMKSMHQVLDKLDRKVNLIERQMQSLTHSDAIGALDDVS